MPKARYHFLTVIQRPSGKSLVTLPGQTLGRKEVAADVLVADRKGQTVVARMKRKAAAGDIFFTTTLKDNTGYYTAADIHPLHERKDIMLSDVEDAYEQYIAKLNSTKQ